MESLNLTSKGYEDANLLLIDAYGRPAKHFAEYRRSYIDGGQDQQIINMPMRVMYNLTLCYDLTNDRLIKDRIRVFEEYGPDWRFTLGEIYNDAPTVRVIHQIVSRPDGSSYGVPGIFVCDENKFKA